MKITVNWPAFAFFCLLIAVVLLASCSGNNDEMETETEENYQDSGIGDYKSDSAMDSRLTEIDAQIPLSPKHDASSYDSSPDIANALPIIDAMQLTDLKECRTTLGELACQTIASCYMNLPCSSHTTSYFHCLNCPPKE